MKLTTITALSLISSSVTALWTALKVVSPGNAGIDQARVGEYSSKVCIGDDVNSYSIMLYEKVEVMYGTHPPPHYFTVNSDNSLNVTLNVGTDGFSSDSDDNLLFNGKPEFAVCRDNGYLYVGEPLSCDNYVNATVQLFEF